eukprot:1257580-Amphidinium_carterae.2
MWPDSAAAFHDAGVALGKQLDEQVKADVFKSFGETVQRFCNINDVVLCDVQIGDEIYQKLLEVAKYKSDDKKVHNDIKAVVHKCFDILVKCLVQSVQNSTESKNTESENVSSVSTAKSKNVSSVSTAESKNVSSVSTAESTNVSSVSTAQSTNVSVSTADTKNVSSVSTADARNVSVFFAGIVKIAELGQVLTWGSSVNEGRKLEGGISPYPQRYWSARKWSPNGSRWWSKNYGAPRPNEDVLVRLSRKSVRVFGGRVKLDRTNEKQITRSNHAGYHGDPMFLHPRQRRQTQASQTQGSKSSWTS